MSNPLDKQVGGNHYKDYPIQPIEYITANELGFLEGNAIKYITRHRDKNGLEDIKKAIHYLELIIEYTYKDKNKREETDYNEILSKYKDLLYKNPTTAIALPVWPGYPTDPGRWLTERPNRNNAVECPACNEVP